MTIVSASIMCGLIVLILLSIEGGYQIGLHRRAQLAESKIVSPAVEASVLGLMGLLIAFTFSGAGSRFDNRRNLIVHEANAIGTAYLRLDLLPAEAQPQLREDFRKYLRSRLAIYQKIPDFEAVKTALERSAVLQDKVWKNAVAAAKASGPAEKSLVLGSLNEMIDITTDRTVALTTHPPAAVFVMLGLTVLASSALVGYSMSLSGTRDWVLIIAFAFVVGAALDVILDYEFPRIGILRIDPVDQVLVQTLEQMN